MMKRLLILALLVICLFALSASVSAQPQDPNEGLSVNTFDGLNSVSITGKKYPYHFQGLPAPHAYFTLTVTCGSTLNVHDQYVTVPLDPDWLEVSDDLGWGGLDADVQVYDAISNSYVGVRINLDVYATGPIHVVTKGGYLPIYTRDGSAFRGQIVTPVCTIPFNSANTTGSTRFAGYR
jgi:hypothetical protein